MEAQYIVDEEGNRRSVILPVEEYERLLDELEELADARDHEQAMADLRAGREERIPFERVRGKIGSEYVPPER